MLKSSDILTANSEIHQETDGSGHGPSINAADIPRILDAVSDQHGGHWIRYGTVTRSCWFSLQELQTNEKDVFSRLSGPGMTFLTTTTRNAFKKVIEAHTEYRSAVVAAHPGWVDAKFVFGDGSVCAPPNDDREVIIAFDANLKFAQHGTLTGWQIGVGRVVKKQPIPLFALAFAFVGPLMRFAPAHLLNPQVELVGKRECGKSTMGALAASVWAGDPNSAVGGGETWDLTINALDQQKLTHCDNLLVLDEGNLAGTTSQDQRELIRKAVFKASTTGGRKRYTDSKAQPNVKLALLSTSNIPLRDLVQAPEAVSGALESRMMTLLIPKDHPLGVLASVPEEFSTTREAMEHLRSLIDLHYGTVGRAFIAQLVPIAAQDEPGLRRRIERLMARFLRKVGKADNRSARVEKTLAITFAAGMLARKWGILPKSWGSLLRAILHVYYLIAGSQGTTASPAPAIDKIRAYVEQHRARIVRVRDVEEPYSPEDFQRKAGFLRKSHGCEEILIPTKRFQLAFPEYGRLMKELREAGLAKTEGGKQAKLSIKAPNKLCSTGRVYCVQLRAQSKAK